MDVLPAPSPGAVVNGFQFQGGDPGDKDAWKPAEQSAPEKGAIVGGHEFLGGNPNDENSWKVSKTGIANNMAAEANEQFATMLGLNPVDFAVKALRMPESHREEMKKARPDLPPDAIDRYVDNYNSALDMTPLGSKWIKGLMGKIGANPDEVKATTPAERIARGTVAGAMGMVAPGALAERTLASTWAKGDELATAALDALKGNGTTSNAVIGAASGASGEAAAEAAPEPYKPVARLVGGLGGGLAGAGAAGIAEAGGNAVRNAWRNKFEPVDVHAARMILDRASQPGTFRETLRDLPDNLVAGSEGTTGEVGNDLGVLSHQADVQASPAGRAAFAERRTAQNIARLGAIRNLADPEASADAVTDYVQGRLKELTALHAARVAGAADDVADTLARAGGTDFDNAAAYGEAIRGPLKELHGQAKSDASALWRAIDPDMKAEVQVGGFKDATEKLFADVPETAKKPEGEEGAIAETIAGLGDSTSFGNLVALRSRLTDAIRSERQGGTPTVLRRLAMTLDNLDDALANTAGELAATPAKKASMMERLALEAKAWQTRAKADVKLEGTTGRGVGSGLEEPVAAGQAELPSTSGTESTTGSRPGLPPGDTGVSGIPPDVAARYAAARGATKEMKQTFESGPVGGALKPGANAGSFSMTPSNVPKNLFDRPEALKAYAKAAGNTAPMEDYAAFSLRQAAVRDGQLVPAKYEKWVMEHAAQLRMFPALKEKLADVRMAQEVLDNSLGAQKEALTAFQKSAAQKFIDKDPAKAVASSIADPKEFGTLVAQVKGNAAATAGLKRAVVDHMLDRTLSTAEAGISGEKQIKYDALQKFIANNAESMSKLFSVDEMNSMKNVAADAERANRSLNAVKTPGQPNTAEKFKGANNSFLEGLVHHALGKGIGAVVGSTLGGIPGGIVGYMAGNGLAAMRATRVDSVEKALAEMMLHPKIAAAAIAKVAPEQEKNAAATFFQRVRAATANQITLEQMRK